MSKCKKCGTPAYAVESVNFLGNVWHNTCLKCEECKRCINTVAEACHNEGSPYCNACHKKLYGLNGFSRAISNPSIRAKPKSEKEENAQGSGAKWTSVRNPKCPMCNKDVFFKEQIRAIGKSYHPLCFACFNCHKTMQSAADACDARGQIYCKACHSREFAPKGIGYGFLVDTGVSKSSGEKELEATSDAEEDHSSPQREETYESIPPRINIIKKSYETSDPETNSGIPVCADCRLPVDHADEINALGKSFHKSCFRCNECGRSLPAVADYNDAEGLIFCDACYKSKHRPNGIEYGALDDTGLPPPTNRTQPGSNDEHLIDDI